MCYVKAVLETLSDLGIAETELSAADFTTISEFEKQEIPKEFLIQTLRQHFATVQYRSTAGMIAPLEFIILDEYAMFLVENLRREFPLSANGS